MEANEIWINPLDETFENYEYTNKKNEKIKESLKNFTEVLIKNKWDLGEPVIIWLQWNPWLWKTHLLRAMQNYLKENGIKFLSNQNNRFFFQKEKFLEEENKIIFLDDLFQDVWSETEFEKFDSWIEISKNYLKKLIFDLYENKKILIVSSNFDIKYILDLLSNGDEIGRLKDRINELLWRVQTLKLEWDSYRKIKAEVKSDISNIFNNI